MHTRILTFFHIICQNIYQANFVLLLFPAMLYMIFFMLCTLNNNSLAPNCTFLPRKYHLIINTLKTITYDMAQNEFALLLQMTQKYRER